MFYLSSYLCYCFPFHVVDGYLNLNALVFSSPGPKAPGELIV